MINLISLEKCSKSFLIKAWLVLKSPNLRSTLFSEDLTSLMTELSFYNSWTVLHLGKIRWILKFNFNINSSLLRVVHQCLSIVVSGRNHLTLLQDHKVTTKPRDRQLEKHQTIVEIRLRWFLLKVWDLRAIIIILLISDKIWENKHKL